MCTTDAGRPLGGAFDPAVGRGFSSAAQALAVADAAVDYLNAAIDGITAVAGLDWSVAGSC